MKGGVSTGAAKSAKDIYKEHKHSSDRSVINSKVKMTQPCLFDNFINIFK